MFNPENVAVTDTPEVNDERVSTIDPSFKFRSSDDWLRRVRSIGTNSYRQSDRSLHGVDRTGIKVVMWIAGEIVKIRNFPFLHYGCDKLPSDLSRRSLSSIAKLNVRGDCRGIIMKDSRDDDGNPSSLVNFHTLLHRSPLQKVNSQYKKTDDRGSSSNNVEPLCDFKLVAPIAFLLALPLLVLGGWLNSQGFDTGNEKLTLIGWLGMAGGVAVLWMILLLFAHLIGID